MNKAEKRIKEIEEQLLSDDDLMGDEIYALEAEKKGILLGLEAGKKEAFDFFEGWLNGSDDDWRAWDSDYLDKYDKGKAKLLKTPSPDKEE